MSTTLHHRGAASKKGSPAPSTTTIPSPIAPVPIIPPTESLLRKMFVRTTVAFIMMFVSISFVYKFQHLGWCCIIVGIQSSVFRELVNLRYKEAREKEIPLFRTCMFFS